MKQKTIKIAGKKIGIAYCYATEIGYKKLAEEDIHEFINEIIKCSAENRNPDARKSTFLITAASIAYYESRDEEAQDISKLLMFDADPDEIGKAIVEILSMYTEWYKLPTGEPKDKKTKKTADGKNA